MKTSKNNQQISSRYGVDQKILEQRARAFDYLFDAVVVTDLNGTITDWNRGSEQLYGYSRDEALGQPVSILHVPDDVGRITAEVLDTVARTGKWTGEIRMRHKSGRIGWIESVVVPLLDEEQKPIGAIGINRDISDRVQQAETLRRLAHYDPLTSLPNRFLLQDRLAHLIAQATRNQRTFSLLFLDLNGFKVINDTQGHATGDEVLKTVAARLLDAVRASDTVARYGGDEFVVLLEDTSGPRDIETIARHVREKVCEPCAVGHQRFILYCSIGVARFPADGLTAEQLLEHADQAMYREKKGSRA